MINLAWGGLTNGAIPTSRLVDVSGRGDYLEPTAAAQFLRMRAAIKADVGFDLEPAAGSSANRPKAIQIEFFTERYTKVSYKTGLWWNGSYWTKNPGEATAAIPGTSNHGWARAIDLNISRYDTAAWAWMQAHAHEYGYDWATGEESGEDWHWECLTPPGTAVAGGITDIIKPKGTKVMKHYPNTDWLAAKKAGRAIAPGIRLRLLKPNTNAAQNLIGSVGPYSIAPHVAGKGFAPGDSIQLTLKFADSKGKESAHYPVIGVADAQGNIAISPSFLREAVSGNSVYCDVEANKANQKTGTITLFACDAYLFN